MLVLCQSPVLSNFSVLLVAVLEQVADLQATRTGGTESAEPEGHFEGQNGAPQRWFGLAYASVSQRIAWSEAVSGTR